MTEQFADRLTAPGRLLVLSPTTIQQANQYFGTSGAIAVGYCYWQQCSTHHFRNCQAQPNPQPANPQVGAGSLILTTAGNHSTPYDTLRHPTTPYTRNSSFACLCSRRFLHYLFTTCSVLLQYLFTTLHFVFDFFMTSS